VRVSASCPTPTLEGQSISLHSTALKSIPSMGGCYVGIGITSKFTHTSQLSHPAKCQKRFSSLKYGRKVNGLSWNMVEREKVDPLGIEKWVASELWPVTCHFLCTRAPYHLQEVSSVRNSNCSNPGEMLVSHVIVVRVWLFSLSPNLNRVPSRSETVKIILENLYCANNSWTMPLSCDRNIIVWCVRGDTGPEYKHLRINLFVCTEPGLLKCME
jgi:hypothetical protein